MSFDDIKESAAMAVATVRANKLRSSLTILGVAIGVVTLTFMVSIIQGLNKAFAEQIESLGSNTIFVSKFDPSFGRPPNDEELHRKEITQEDADAIRTEAANAVESVAPIRRKIASDLRYADKETDTPILFGVTPDYEYTISQYVGRGRFVTETDLIGREDVAVLAQDGVRALFPCEGPLGKEIKIDGRPPRVVRVLEPLGNFFGQSRANSGFIPLARLDQHWRDARKHSLAVSSRGRRLNGPRRRRRPRRRRGREPPDEQVLAAPGLRAALGHTRRHRHLCERRHRLRAVARMEGRETRPD